MKDDESLVLSSNLKGLPVQVVEHRCYAVLVRIFSCYKACPFSLDFFQELECLVYGMGPILLKCTRDVVVLMK